MGPETPRSRSKSAWSFHAMGPESTLGAVIEPEAATSRDVFEPRYRSQTFLESAC